MATTDRLADLLIAAIRRGDAEMQAWYRALADASPLWARQQEEYERQWGRQTTKLQPTLTPWRLMSQRAEDEANTTDSPLAVARWYLETVKAIPDGTPFRYDDIKPFLDLRHSNNQRQDREAVSALIDFAKRGMPKAELSAVRNQVLGRARQPRANAGLREDTIKTLILDAENWLGAFGTWRDQSGSTERHRLRLALPFLDCAETDWIIAPEAATTPWRWTALYFIHHRLDELKAHVEMATLIRYFGSSAAHEFETRGPASNPVRSSQARLRSGRTLP